MTSQEVLEKLNLITEDISFLKRCIRQNFGLEEDLVVESEISTDGQVLQEVIDEFLSKTSEVKKDISDKIDEGLTLIKEENISKLLSLQEIVYKEVNEYYEKYDLDKINWNINWTNSDIKVSISSKVISNKYPVTVKLSKKDKLFILNNLTPSVYRENKKLDDIYNIDFKLYNKDGGYSFKMYYNFKNNGDFVTFDTDETEISLNNLTKIPSPKKDGSDIKNFYIEMYEFNKLIKTFKLKNITFGN